MDEMAVSLNTIDQINKSNDVAKVKPKALKSMVELYKELTS